MPPDQDTKQRSKAPQAPNTDGRSDSGELNKAGEVGSTSSSLPQGDQIEEGTEEAGIQEAEPKPPPPVVRVKLLPDQIERIAERTGVRLDVLEIPDANGILMAIMRTLTPPEVERLALEYARGEKAVEEATQDALRDLAAQQDADEEALKAIEAEVQRQKAWAEAQKKKMKEAAEAGAEIKSKSAASE